MDNHSQIRTERELREQAEAMLPGPADAYAGDDHAHLKLLHELQVHQVELELQNQELRETRSELESALSRYLDFYDLSPVAFLTLEHGSLVREANRRAYSLFDCERPGLLGQPLRDYVALADRAQFNTCLTQVLDDGSNSSRIFEGDVVTAHRTLRVRMELFSVDTGGLCRVVALDVTSARQCERELTREQARLRQVMDASPNLVFVKDAEGRLMFGNIALAEYCGIPADQLAGHLAPDFPRPTNSAGDTCKQCVVAPDGGTRFFVTREAPLVGTGNGSDAGTLVVATDITELRHAEAALHEAEQVKTGLLAMMGYDMREFAAARHPVHPPAAIPAEAGATRGDGYRVLAEQVRQLAQTVDALIGDASGAPAAPAGEVDLDAVVGDAVKIATLGAEDTRLSVDVSLPQDRIWVCGEATGLTQALLALLTHAMNAAPSPSRVGLRAVARAGDNAVDVFIGVEADRDAASLSEVFEQATTVDDASGAEPGVRLARKLVAAHGGKIAALGPGAFVVRLSARTGATAPPR